MPTGVKVKVGGFNVRVGAGGLDSDGLAGHAVDKVKDKLLGCVIVGGVLLLLALITLAVVIAKIVFF
jgi:hypothetical protein